MGEGFVFLVVFCLPFAAVAVAFWWNDLGAAPWSRLGRAKIRKGIARKRRIAELMSLGLTASDAEYIVERQTSKESAELRKELEGAMNG